MANRTSDPSLTRRTFLAQSAAVGAALTVPGLVHAQGRERIKVGLIGCGGRGSGAARDILEADRATEIHAVADVFAERANGCQQDLLKIKDRCFITSDRVFTGFDAYKNLLATDVDVVILATPPAFRPMHLKAAIEAGKHVFMEKPVAVDAMGVRSVIESSALAAQKNLAIVAGTQRRHDVAYREAIARIHDGKIGDVVALYAYWNQGGLWMNPRQPNWSDMEWQLRNWLYFTWLSGDHIVEQHIHNLDVCNWAMQAHPVKAVSLGGRQVRTDAAYGHIFDHFATEYEYANGVKMLSMCRQIDGTASRVSEHIVGSKAKSNAQTAIWGGTKWRFEGDRPNPYMLEHRNLIRSIREGKPINEGKQVAESTLTAIMGRMSAYTGAEVTWEQAMKSEEALVPGTLAFGNIETPPVAIPGKTSLR
ncbi:MAG: Gfo/Idh/MocA family oxidoreductase [Fimbriimonadaceae bacterium]|nr:Gfo/Idh/MocA family oxidoreductase [Fimbriimonadaceae bacterium]